jgi:hypothetical protein
LTEVTLIETVLLSLFGASHVTLTGVHVSGSPRSVTLNWKLSGPL